jgi:YD repeat-containing protein
LGRYGTSLLHPAKIPYPLSLQKHSLGVALCLVGLFYLNPGQAEYRWQDTFKLKNWPTSAAACYQGEAEARLADYKKQNPGLLFKISQVTVNQYSDTDSECRIEILRWVAINWIQVTQGDPIPHYRSGSPDICPRGATDDSGYCQPKQPDNNCTREGNPINTASAKKYQIERDYTGAVDFVRYYNSLNAEPGAFGKNWRHNYQRSLAVTGLSGSAINQVKVYREDGRRFDFILNGSAWQPDADANMTLTRSVDSNANTTQWQLKLPDDSLETYNPEGRLLTIKHRTGVIQNLAYYADGKLQTVDDGFGRAITLAYNATTGFIEKLTGPDLVEYSYGYDIATGHLKTVTFPDKTASTTDNPVKTYHYGSDDATEAGYAGGKPDALTGITDENGDRYATFKYNSQGMALTTEHATGGIDQYTMAYFADDPVTVGVVDPYTEITDPLCNVNPNPASCLRKVHFQTILGVMRPVSRDQPAGSGCAAAASQTQYDTNGNTLSIVDFNNHKTCYAYNSRNLEIERVEGLPASADCPTELNNANLSPPARRITTDWHPSYRLPVKIAEPKKLTTYTRDTAGNVLFLTEQATADADGTDGLAPVLQGNPRSWGYTYNSYGEVLTEDGPRNNATDANDTTTQLYYPANDSIIARRNKLHTATSPLNHTTTYDTYDNNGRPTQITLPDGTLKLLSYHPRGWLETTETKNSAGTLSEKTQYDYYPTGLLHTATQPNGSVLTYQYDSAHRLTEVTDSLSAAGVGNKVVYELDAMGNRLHENYYAPNSTVSRRKVDRVYDPLNRLQTITGGVQ